MSSAENTEKSTEEVKVRQHTFWEKQHQRQRRPPNAEPPPGAPGTGPIAARVYIWGGAVVAAPSPSMLMRITKRTDMLTFM